MRALVLVAAVSVLVGCASATGFVDFKSVGVYSSENAGNKKFEDVGPVQVDHSGFVWSGCDRVATEAVKELLDVAKTRGANTVYKVRFQGKNGLVTTPTCVVRWGWFLLYILPGLGPWVTATSVEGIAATVEGSGKNAGAIPLPADADTAALAAEYVRSLREEN